MTGTSSAVRRVSSLVLAVVFFLSALTFLIPGKADQLPPTQSLKVYAQYYADPSTVTLLKEFSRAEMNDLSYSDIGDELYYCNVTRYKTLMRVHARGVILKDFLSDVVGVDLNSVRALHFHTSDVDADARFLSKGRQELLDDVRWYYPNLNDNAHYDRETDEFVIEDEAKALEGARPVPTMLAVVQYSTKDPRDDLSDPMTEEDTFRLCEGQLDLTTATSFESARAVDAIYIEFAGSPPEEPTEKPTQPDEKPTGSDVTPTPEDPTTPTEPEKPTGSNITPAPTTPQSQQTTRRTTQRTTRRTLTTRNNTVTNRTVTMTTSPYIAQGTTAANGNKMGQLVVNGYDVQWRKESEEEVTPLQKRTVKTSGVRNAVLLFLASFAAGGVSMFEWFKKER